MKLRLQCSRHFWDRWNELVGPGGKGARDEVRRKLHACLKVGIKPDKTGAYHLRVRSRAWVVVVPTNTGWRAVTVHNGRKIEERKKKARR